MPPNEGRWLFPTWAFGGKEDRDHYEGTEFDLTRGKAAGPFGCPYRFLGDDDAAGDVADPTAKREGAWERPLSV